MAGEYARLFAEAQNRRLRGEDIDQYQYARERLGLSRRQAALLDRERLPSSTKRTRPPVSVTAAEAGRYNAFFNRAADRNLDGEDIDPFKYARERAGLSYDQVDFLEAQLLRGNLAVFAHGGSGVLDDDEEE